MNDQAPDRPQEIQGDLTVGNARIAIVVSRFNSYLTSHMLDAAVNYYHRLGGDPKNLKVVHVPGAFELPVTAKHLAQTGSFDAIVCLGCVIRGETDHYDHIVEQAAKGIRQVATLTGVPTIFGVITAESLEQAINRAGAKQGNQGAKAMLTAIEMASVIKKITPLGPPTQ